MKHVARLANDEIADVFTAWNSGDLNSYLVEITAAIMRIRDPENPSVHMVDLILDEAEQKGTGKWTSQEALEIGVPVTLIAEAVFARYVPLPIPHKSNDPLCHRLLSGMKGERSQASKLYPAPPPVTGLNKAAFISDLQGALYASKLVSYAQGFAMCRSAALVSFLFIQFCT